MKEDSKQALWIVVAVVCILSVSSFGIASWFVGNEPVVEVIEPELEPVNLGFVSGTEYFPGQEGQVAILLLGASGNPVTFDFNCTYTVLYPNKTTFVGGTFTQNTSVDTYYTNFTVPNIEGVYEYSSVCVDGGRTATAGKSFHVTKKQIRAVTPK